MHPHSTVAIIGGSGVKDSPSFKDLQWHSIDTEYSNGFGRGVVEYQTTETGVIFIPRHGHTARFGPSRTQYAANLIAAKMMGVKTIIGTSAVGSLNEIEVGSLVIPDDYIDESGRDDNLFGQGLVVHANPIPPFSEHLRKLALDAATQIPFTSVHNGGTYVVIPGDRFGTLAEGKRRMKYAGIVGMTLAPEASMALQLGLHYVPCCFVVDTNLEANHDGKTLEVMHRLSTDQIVPKFISRLCESSRKFSDEAPLLDQLMGNLIVGDTTSIQCKALQEIAVQLIKDYTK